MLGDRLGWVEQCKKCEDWDGDGEQHGGDGEGREQDM